MQGMRAIVSGLRCASFGGFLSGQESSYRMEGKHNGCHKPLTMQQVGDRTLEVRALCGRAAMDRTGLGLVGISGVFTNAPNARQWSLVSAIPITEKLLLNAGGWQAMKPARELLKGGRVSEVKYEPPLLSGYVREGGRIIALDCESKARIDVENICSCWESRSAGKICAHSVAVGLGYLNPPAVATVAPVEPTIPETPAGSAVRRHGHAWRNRSRHCT